MVERLVVESESHKADMSICRYVAFDAVTNETVFQEKYSGKRSFAGKVINYRKAPDGIFNITTPFVNTKFFRRQFLSDNDLIFDTDLIRGEDLLFTYKSLILANRIYVIDDVLFRYRVNVQGSVITRKESSNMTTLLALQKLKKFLENQGVYSVVKRSYIQRVFDTALYDYSGQDELFLGQYAKIRRFLQSLSKDINASSQYFINANHGRLSYNDIMRVIKNDKASDFYVAKAKDQASHIESQQVHISKLKNELEKLKNPGIKTSIKMLQRAIKRRLTR
jgi:hypothetical protein